MTGNVGDGSADRASKTKLHWIFSYKRLFSLYVGKQLFVFSFIKATDISSLLTKCRKQEYSATGLANAGTTEKKTKP